MLVKEWMTHDPLTVTPDTSVMRASQMMKENTIRRLPVTDDQGRLVGIITETDLKDASPSKATTLDVHELYYLLAELKVKDIMTREVITIGVGETVEKAAVKMLEHRITGLPVMDGGKLVGVISQGDVFRLLTTITGVYRGGIQMAFNLADQAMAVQDVTDFIRNHGAAIISVLSSYEMTGEGRRNVYFRIEDMPAEALEALVDELRQHFNVLFVVRDDLSDI
ncbi:putative signal transduction protein with CBS domains [Desulfarculus baarsii DSM 2075]|uniref:Signal transduction protein with CBS domains n=1 Tax=Desulfarculus baarsii (strain ATCC 33931 / DSM 2075 / LMG 7858 / VKM B-1802 / 2st14) TaxID=644282 RepID=E1QKK6_DESB2|nr:CBS domain-containing protein [Desulfarculus baarsii]ADK86099.1 putative signal transduction protein with CBS domains [Desulfarculus baarsii DSM 2075]